MKSTLEELTRNLLELPAEERARLAEILLESLDYEDDFPVSDEWKQEIQRRCQEIDSGQVKLIPADSALEMLQKKYS